MNWPRTPSAWERREKLIVLCLAAVVAIGALAPFLGWVAAPIGMATAGAIAAGWRVYVGARKANLEETLEEAELDRRLRCPIAAVSSIDPRQIGVDPATQDILPGGEVPEYLPRSNDHEARQALEDALDASGRWIVAVCGSSKTGKSRLLFEAIKWCGELHELHLVAPKDGDAVKSLLQPEQLPARLFGKKLVVWLDDVETFVAEEIDLDALREWHERDGVIFAVTYGGKGSERIGAAGDTGLSVITETLLHHAKQIVISKTDAAELEALPADLADSLQQEIERHGLAAVMVSGPALERKLVTGRHAPGEPECPSGAAVVRAAVDWARCGRTDPIPTRKLRQLWNKYLPVGVHPSDELFDEGLEWAMRPVSGTIALLYRVASFLPYDYIVSFVEAQSPDGPSDSAWAAALEDADPGQAFSVAVRAFNVGRDQDALTGMTLASKAEDKSLARLAIFNVGVLLKEMGEEKRAEERFESADQMGSSAAANNLGFMLLECGELEKAEAAFRRSAEREDLSGAFNLGLLLMVHKEGLAEAERWFRFAHSLGHKKAVNNVGVLLERKGDEEGAKAAYRTATEEGDPSGFVNLGRLLYESGDQQEAKNAFKRADEIEPGKGSYGLGRALDEAGDLDEAEIAFRRALDMGSGEPVNFGLAVVLLQKGDLEGAREQFKLAVDNGPEEMVEVAERALRELSEDQP